MRLEDGTAPTLKELTWIDTECDCGGGSGNEIGSNHVYYCFRTIPCIQENIIAGRRVNRIFMNFLK